MTLTEETTISMYNLYFAEKLF